MTLGFFRLRYWFQALDAVRFPRAKSANILRGAFGLLLRDYAPPSVYSRVFEPVRQEVSGPSGFADPPRPFVFRAAHLDATTVPVGDPLYFDFHLFDLQRSDLPALRRSFEKLAVAGLGPGRARVRLDRTEQLDLAGRASRVLDSPLPPCEISLDPGEPASQVLVRFVTPTELKTAGSIAANPEFPILLGRLRDRVSNLSALYGRGPLAIDFRGMAERAASVRTLRCDIDWEEVERKSSRTGQIHPIGGFKGEVEYVGPLGEFLPWLHAGRWTGVGRQTVWGKGELWVG
jgi:hypothetical protein